MTPLEIFNSIWTEKVTIQFIEAVNFPSDTSTFDDEWGAALYQSTSRADVTLGSTPWVEESGFFLIGLFTRSGNGPKALDGATAQVRAAFHGAARDGLVIEQVDGPHDVDPAADGEWWQVAMTASFKFQTRRSATGPLFGSWLGFPDAAPPPP